MPLDVDYRCTDGACASFGLGTCFFVFCFVRAACSIALCLTLTYTSVSCRMDSDVCITDFDSDDENVIWPQSQNVTDDDDYLDSENIATSRHLWQARCIREFGECVDNNNWVECRSKSRPDLLYFHNTHSGCSTWHRPVSRYVDVPFVSIQRVSQLEARKK